MISCKEYEGVFYGRVLIDGPPFAEALVHSAACPLKAVYLALQQANQIRALRAANGGKG